MSIFVDENTKVIVQGLTGGQGRFHGLRNRDYGTKVVGGDTPDDLGAVVTVSQAVKATLAPGESLDDHLGVLIDENAHSSSLGVRERDDPAGGVQHRGFSDQ